LQPASSTLTDRSPADATYRKITLRLIPLLFICYTLNYMDRVNIGYAQLQMKHALNFNDAIYGLGAGIFFLGYFIFEVPSNLLLNRIGARKTILRIMFCWGAMSAATLFVTTSLQFYIVRFLLGVFEAGLFPGIILYLTYWYPPARRARVVSLFMLATVAAGLIGGPTSGWILQNMNGVNGWAGWQWMFLLEGLPSSALGILTYLYLSDGPAAARWMSDAEKELVRRDVASATAAQGVPERERSHHAFLDLKVYLLSFVLFCVLCGSYALSFWLPTVIHELGVTSMQQVGLYATIPEIIAAIATLLYSRHSDKHAERHWHFAIAALLGALALSATTLFRQDLGMSLAMFGLARACIVSSLPVFWAMSTSQLSVRSSVAGIAVIASLSNMSGVLSPYLLGLIKNATGSLDNGLYVISILMVIAAICVLRFIKRPDLRNASGLTQPSDVQV